MGALSVRLPDSLHVKVRQLAEHEGISINQFIATAVTVTLAALMTEEHPGEGSKHGSRARHEAALAQVPDVEPEVDDPRVGK
jgi:hypothetical protein